MGERRTGGEDVEGHVEEERRRAEVSGSQRTGEGIERGRHRKDQWVLGCL